MDIKFIAFYLPQFHEIPENNEWWGEGFTEWERVKNAKPLFPGHKQPRIPYKYYDLSDINVLKEQTEMAKKYGLDGFCYYHYWFNGKKLLEKPLENMLAAKEINMPFCLSWANEPWTRAWNGKPKEMLITQEYGSEKEWLEHLNYLIPFFKDERYIKVDNRPVFLIYRTESFPKFDDMVEFWNKEIKKSGLNKLYLVETLNSYQKKPKCKNSDAIVEFEPVYTAGYSYNIFINKLYNKINKQLRRRSYKIINYDAIWNKIINRNKNYKKVKFRGAFVDWDNTPRFKEKATIYQGATPDKFYIYLLNQVNKCKENENIIFINAWNEWAEGVNLEPDNFNGYDYLEVISKITNPIK